MLLLAIAACRESGSDPAAAPAEPVAAVQAMAQRLAEDDLIGYAKLSVPPSQYQRLQQAWADGHSQWPLTGLPLGDQLLPMLAALREPLAESYAALDRSAAAAAELPHRERVLTINHRLTRRILDAHAAWLDEAEAELRDSAARRR